MSYMSTYSQGWSVCANINVHGQVCILPTSQETIVNKKSVQNFYIHVVPFAAVGWSPSHVTRPEDDSEKD